MHSLNKCYLLINFLPNKITVKYLIFQETVQWCNAFFFFFKWHSKGLMRLGYFVDYLTFQVVPRSVLP